MVNKKLNFFQHIPGRFPSFKFIERDLLYQIFLLILRAGFVLKG